MMDLATLRTFLKLGARAEIDGIPAGEVLRQEQTVLSALGMLEKRPGLALADEVGMGKTFEALGIAAAVRHANPESRVVVVTPSPELKVKWAKDIVGFRAMYDFGQQVGVARSLRDFVEAVRTHPIVLAPVTMFRTGGGQDDQAQLLALYCRWKELPHQTAHAIFRRVFPEGQSIPDVRERLFLDEFEWRDLEPHLERAFRSGDTPGSPGLDDAYSDAGLDAFCNGDAVRRALNRARFELCGCLLPKIDLLIVDEAHKLKNPASLQTTGMRHVFEKRFDKVLLLTATPFQLDVGELREIFKLFAQATTAPPGLMQHVNTLLDEIRRYQEQYNAFQQTWLKLDPLLAEEFSARYEAEGLQAQFDDAGLRIVRGHVKALRQLKDDKIEPGFRTWIAALIRPGQRPPVAAMNPQHHRPARRAGKPVQGVAAPGVENQAAPHRERCPRRGGVVPIPRHLRLEIRDGGAGVERAVQRRPIHAMPGCVGHCGTVSPLSRASTRRTSARRAGSTSVPNHACFASHRPVRQLGCGSGK